MRRFSLLVLPAIFAVHGPMPAFAQAQPDTAVDPHSPDAVKCRKLAVTGSMARKVRTCRTNAEWRALSEQQGRDARDLVERNRSMGNGPGI